ncbi:hypothetical protein, partial [Aeromonas caviae]|uniref:hypothetical protein n=1 Tax=Aeromonas caviae TaxID=648 RepID=UPI0025B66179
GIRDGSRVGVLGGFGCGLVRVRFIGQSKGAAVAVTAKQARELKAGLDERAFNELVAVLTGGDL